MGVRVGLNHGPPHRPPHSWCWLRDASLDPEAPPKVAAAFRLSANVFRPPWLAVHLPQDPDQHRPEDPILLAFDQEQKGHT
jgi:hypothetical protein